jgi:hypothetical protein
MKGHGADMLWKVRVGTYEEIEGVKGRWNEGDAGRRIETDIFTYNHIYTQTPLNADALHTDTFTHNPFTHKHFYTQSLLHTISHNKINNVYTQTLLHRNASTHKRFHTPTQLQTHLHANAFTHKLFYTQTLLPTSTCARRPFTHTRKNPSVSETQT